MRGYKVFHSDFTCNGYQFALGQTFTHNEQLKLCESGFHFCERLADCFSYYQFDPQNIVCEVECENVSEETHDDDSKRVCGQITIVKQLMWHEVLDLANIGFANTGYGNSGDSNSGYYNSGYNNSGNCNTGNNNSGNRNSGNSNCGNRNSGHYNSGRYNSGNRNSGHHNVGNCNSGNNNSGDCNSGNNNSGMFNRTEPNMRLFECELPMTVSEFYTQYHIDIDLELTKVVDGKLVEFDYKEAWKNWWNQASIKQRNQILNLPNFNAEIFFDITGIDLRN